MGHDSIGVSSTSHHGLSQLLQDHYHESLEDHHELLLLYLQVPLPLVQRRLSETLEQELQILALISKMWEDFRRRTYQLS
jgi:hypothetical protein